MKKTLLLGGMAALLYWLFNASEDKDEPTPAPDPSASVLNGVPRKRKTKKRKK